MAVIVRELLGVEDLKINHESRSGQLCATERYGSWLATMKVLLIPARLWLGSDQRFQFHFTA